MTDPSTLTPNQILHDAFRLHSSRHLDTEVPVADLARLADMAIAALRAAGRLPAGQPEDTSPDEGTIRADERARVVFRLQRRVRFALDYDQAHAVEGDPFWQRQASGNQGALDLVGWLADEFVGIEDAEAGSWARRTHDLNAPLWAGPIERNLWRATAAVAVRSLGHSHTTKKPVADTDEILRPVPHAAARLNPPKGGWTVRSWWFNLPNGHVADDSGFAVTEQSHPTWTPARQHALHLTPCRGAVAVVVYDPLGDLFAHWDRFSNIAHSMWADEETEAWARTLQEVWEQDRNDVSTSDQASASPIVQPEAASGVSDRV